MAKAKNLVALAPVLGSILRPALIFVMRGWQRGDRDPVSRTNFNKIHASRFESVIVGETSGKRNFHDQTQIIHESRIPHEINHASHAFRYSRITFLLSNFHASRSSFSPYHASRINPLPPSYENIIIFCISFHYCCCYYYYCFSVGWKSGNSWNSLLPEFSRHLSH